MSLHRWSGWPGAFCLDCGAEDAVENALALGWIDFEPDPNDPNSPGIVKYDTPEHEAEVLAANNNCPVQRD